MRPRRSTRSKLAIVLTLALGLLTPMAANMVGAQAGALEASAVRPIVIRMVADATPRGFALPASGVRPNPAHIARVAARVARWTNVLVKMPRTLPAFARPRAGATQVGVVPAGSKYYGIPIVAWVEEVSADGRWGRVELPYTWPRREGWIRLHGLHRDVTRVRVEVDLSTHTVIVRKFGNVLFRAPGATGAPSTPTPVGEYFVTDRVSVLRWQLRHVRVRHQRHPAPTARRLVGREPARDPRHEQPFVDRSERERRMRPRLGVDPGPADPFAGVRHARHRARVARSSVIAPLRGSLRGTSPDHGTCASACSNGPRPIRSCPIR